MQEKTRFVKSGSSNWRPFVLGRLILSLLVMLPVPALARLGRGLGYVFYVFDRKRRHYASVNLKICFPGLNASDHRQLLKKHFKALGQSLLCTLGITWVMPDKRITKYVSIEGEENLSEQQGAGNNMIVMAPHFVGLELAWAWLSMTRPMVGMYREPRKNILHWAIDDRRTQFGGLAVEAQAQLKSLIKMIRDGKPFFYLPDLDPGSTGRYEFAPFFGTMSATWTALGRITSMTHARVIPCIVIQHMNGSYTIRFGKALENYPSKNELEDVSRLNSLIEEAVKDHPEQYFWIHRRFKTRPEGEASFYGRKRTGYR